MNEGFVIIETVTVEANMISDEELLRAFNLVETNGASDLAEAIFLATKKLVSIESIPELCARCEKMNLKKDTRAQVYSLIPATAKDDLVNLSIVQEAIKSISLE